MKLQYCTAFYMLFYIITRFDGSESSTIDNIVRLSTGVSISNLEVSSYQVMLNLCLFMPMILTSIKEKSEIHKVKNYIIIRKDAGAFYKCLLERNIVDLGKLVALKCIIELSLAFSEWAINKSIIITIVELNVIYVMFGLIFILTAELMNMYFSLKFQVVLALFCAGIIILQYCNCTSLFLEIVLIPVPFCTTKAFPVILIVRVQEVAWLMVVMHRKILLLKEKGAFI